MIARNDAPDGRGRNGHGRVTRCVTFEREAFTDLQELAWAANVPVDQLVREAVERFRRAPAPRA